MSRMSRFLDEALLKIKLDEKKKEAEYIIKDETRLLKFLDKVRDKLRKVPVVGTYLEEIPILVSMLMDYKSKKYNKLPTSSIVSIIAALVYFLSPIDMVPDFIVGMGLLDDALVLKIALDGIRYNIHEYQEWKEMNKEEGTTEAQKEVDGFFYEDLDKVNEKASQGIVEGQRDTVTATEYVEEQGETVTAAEYVEEQGETVTATEYVDEQVETVTATEYVDGEYVDIPSEYSDYTNFNEEDKAVD